MRVLFISTADYKYGTTKSLMNTILELRKEYDVEPVVLTKRRNTLNELCDELQIENYHYWYRDIMAGSAYSNFGLNVAKHMVKYFFYIMGSFTQNFFEKCGLNMSTIDLIHTNHIRVDIGAYLSRKYKKPHIWHIKELNKGHVRIRHYKPRCYGYINKNANAFIAVTKQVKEYWVEAGLAEEKVHVIYNGLDTKDFSQKRIRDDNLLKLIIVGRVEEAKGQMHILEALMKIPKEIRENIRLDIYGDAYPDYCRKLKKFIEKNKLQEIVTLKGYCSNMPEMLANYDVGILASRGDAFGTVVAEYMAAGLFAIATYTELAEHMKTGLRYTFGDIDKLAENILFAYQHREEAQQIAGAGRETIQRDFSRERNAKEIYALYRRVLDNEK